MARTRRLRRNFEEGGTRIEDTDAAHRAIRVARAQAGGQVTGRHPPGRPRKHPARDAGGREPDHRLPEVPETLSPRPPRRRRPAPPRAVDRQRFAHELPPPEPIPLHLDHPLPPERAWRPDEMPTAHTPSVAGFSLTGALLAIPINAIRFC